MAAKNGGKIFFRILGFLVLAGSLSLIGLGLAFIIPEIETFEIPENLYYIMGGVAGILIAVIILILAFIKTAGKNKNLNKPETIKVDPNTWNEDNSNMHVLASSPAPAAKPAKVSQKASTTGFVICQKCGTENFAGDYYCSGCKSALKKICKLCGHDNPHGIEICEGCGKVLQ